MEAQSTVNESRWRIVAAMLLVGLAAFMRPLDTLAIPISVDVPNKEFDLGRLGKIIVKASSSYDPATRASAGQKLEFSHKLKSSDYSFPHLLIQSNASVADMNSLHAGENELGQLKVEFSGLLLNGLPSYFNAKFLDFFHANQIEFQYDPKKSSSSATLTRKIKFNIRNKEIKDLQDFNVNIRDIERKIAELQALPNNDSRRSELSSLNGKYLKAKDMKSDVLRKISKQEVPCFPEFKKVTKFPIWEKGGDAPISKGSSSAKIGVSGDMEIKLKPRCGLAVGSNATLDAYVAVDVSVISHGNFGARADASAAFSEEFGTNNAMEYRFISDPVVGEEERRTLRQIMLDSVVTRSDVKEANDALLNAVKNDSVLSNLKNQILENLIGTPTNPAPTDKLCKIFQERHVPAGSPEEVICKFASAGPPKLADLPEPPPIPMPEPPKGTCDLTLQIKPCLPAGAITVPQLTCPPCRHNLGSLNPCSCSVPSLEAPTGCVATNNSIQQLCKAINEFPRIYAKAQQDERDRVANYRRDLDRLKADFDKRTMEFVRYSDQKFIYETAQAFAQVNIINATFSEPVAKSLVNAAWDSIDKGQQQIDLIADIVNRDFLKYLKIQAKGSARIAFTSTAHLLEISPRLETSIGYCHDSKGYDGKLCGTVLFYQNTGAKPRIGDIDMLGMTIDADASISFAGKEQPLPKIHKEVKTMTIEMPITISNKPESKDFRIY